MIDPRKRRSREPVRTSKQRYRSLTDQRRAARALRVELLEDRRLLTITVNTLVDENNGVGVGGVSLREAVSAAVAGETINFAATLTSGGAATMLLTAGQIAISQNLTINGPGAGLLTIDAQSNSRIFD